MSNYCWGCGTWHNGRCGEPVPTGLQEGANGKLLPVYRVKAWRTANEDRAPRVSPQEHLMGRYLCLVCHTGPVHSADCPIASGVIAR